MNFLSSIGGYISGFIAIIGGLFFLKKYNDKQDEIIDLQNKNNNLKAEKEKSEIEKENIQVENIKLEDKIKIKDFEGKIEKPKSQKEIDSEVADKISKENSAHYKIEL